MTLSFTNESVAAKTLFVANGNGNGRLDTNECSLVGGSISNQTAQALTNLSVELMPLSGGVTISHPIFTFTNLSPLTLTPLPPTAVVSVASNVVCGFTVGIALILRQNGVLSSSNLFNFVVGSGGSSGCTDGGGVCTYCPDVVIHGSLLSGDFLQAGTLAEDGQESKCGSEGTFPGLVPTGARLADALVFQNGPKTACITVQLKNLCADASSELFGAAYTGSFNPSDLCAGFLADIGTAVGGSKTGEFSFRVRPNETFVLTVNEYRSALSCGDYRLTVSGGDCRPRLNLQDIAGPNVRVSWPNSAAEWLPQAASTLNSWSDLAVTPTNAAGKYFFDTSAAQSPRFFRLRQP